MDSNKRLIEWFNDAEDDWTSQPIVRYKDNTIDDDWGLEKQSHCFLFRGVVTQILEGKEIILDDNNLIKYDRCNITDLSVGDLVDVEINDRQKLVVKSTNRKIIFRDIIDFDEELSQFIIAGNAFIQKTSSTEQLKIGDHIKCTIIETNNSDYKWRAYPYIEEWNLSSNVTFVDDFEQTLPENDSDFLCYRFNQLSSDINTKETETKTKWNGSYLGLYLIPSELTDILGSKRPLLSYSPELDGALDSDNYGKRFHTLLYLEEYQNEKNLKKYNLSEIRLRKVGKLFAIEVPSLAEGRPSLIRGDRVLLFAEQITLKTVSYIGVIKEIRKDEILVLLNKVYRQVDSDSTFSVEFQLIRTVYRRCHQAIDLMGLMSNEILFSSAVTKPALKDIRLESMDWFKTSLNNEQKTAVMGVLRAECRPKPFIIFGPPGTGKTVTIVESILQVFYKIPESRLIVCTSTNSAIDLIAEKLLDSNQIPIEDIVRLSAAYRMDSIPISIRAMTRVADRKLDNWFYKRVILTTTSLAGVIFYYSHFSEKTI